MVGFPSKIRAAVASNVFMLASPRLPATRNSSAITAYTVAVRMIFSATGICYPSGHKAATCCLYIAIAILVIGHARGWWRWLLLVPAIVMLTATTLLIKPSAASQPRKAGAGIGARLPAPSFDRWWPARR